MEISSLPNPARIRTNLRAARAALLACIVLSSVAAVSGPASAGTPPTVTGTIPVLGIVLGQSNLSAYDLTQVFSEPDGDLVNYSLLYQYNFGGPDVVLNGSMLGLKTVNASFGGGYTQFRVTAEDPDGAATTQFISTAYVGPAAVTAREWVNSTSTGSIGWGTDEGCWVSSTSMAPLVLPADAQITEYSWEAWAVYEPPASGGPNGSTNTTGAPAALGNASRLSLSMGGIEVLNVSLSEAPQRVFVDPTQFNRALASASAPFNLAFLAWDTARCAWGARAMIWAANQTLNYVRLPTGDNGSGLLGASPQFAGTISDFNISAGASASAAVNVSSHFSDADGDPLQYTVNVVSPATWQEGSMVFDLFGGTMQVRILDANWSSSLTVNVSAHDPAGNRAYSNQFVVRIDNTGGNSSGPAFTGSVSNMSAQVGVSGVHVVDAADLFTDPAGGGLTFSIDVPSNQTGAEYLRFSLNRSDVYVAVRDTGGWTGTVCAQLRATDSQNQSAVSNLFCVTVTAPANAPPAPSQALPPINVILGSAPGTLLDLAQFFTDDGSSAQLTFAAIEGPEPGWASADLVVDGHLLTLVTAAPVAPGPLTFRVEVTDEWGATFVSPPATLDLFAQLPSVTVSRLGGPQSTPIEEGVSLSFGSGLPDPLPPGIAVSWFLDGELVGSGALLTGIAPTPGAHTIEARVSNGQATVTDQIAFTVQAKALPPTKSPENGSLFLAIAAVGIAFLGLAAGRTERGRYFLLAALLGSVFSRMKKPSLLDHFVRGALYQEIRQEPGVHFEELRRRTGLANGQASHHLRTLENAGYVRVVVQGTRTRFYPTDRPLDPDEYGISAKDREVLVMVVDKPGITQRDIATALGRSSSAVSRTVGRLSTLGYVNTARKDRGVAVFPRASPEPVRREASWPEEQRA